MNMNNLMSKIEILGAHINVMGSLFEQDYADAAQTIFPIMKKSFDEVKEALLYKEEEVTAKTKSTSKS